MRSSDTSRRIGPTRRSTDSIAASVRWKNSALHETCWRPRAEKNSCRETILSLDSFALRCCDDVRAMKQRFHTIIKPERNGWYVGWVEEIPGTITQAKSLHECRRNLRDALELMIE